jgi:hypothetical protein
MPNGIEPEGDDQKWKREVDRQLAAAMRLISILMSQTGKN